MSSKGFLKNNEGTILPITRGDLVLDSSGNPALRSETFKALAPDEDNRFPEGAYGLMSPTDKEKLNNLEANIEDCKVLQSEINTAFEGQIPVLLANPENTENEPTIAYKASEFIYVTPSEESLTVPYVHGIADEATLIHSDKGIGSNIQPVYVSPGGTVTACDGNVGGPDRANTSFQLMYVNAGKYSVKSGLNIGKCTSNSECQLLQVSDGVLKVMASGDIGGVDKNSINPTYKPIHLSGGKLKPCGSTIGSETRGVYMSSGYIKAMSHVLEVDVLNATYTKTTIPPLAIYDTSTSPPKIKRLKTGVGLSNQPIYINTSGVPSAIEVTDTTVEMKLVGAASTKSGLNRAESIKILGGNTIYASGGFYEASDATLKTFGDDVKIDFNTLKNIPKKYFKWNSDKTEVTHLGTSAQELQKLYPELVQQDSDGHLVVAYDKLSIIALKAIDDLYDIIVDLKASNEELKARINSLESK